MQVEEGKQQNKNNDKSYLLSTRVHRSVRVEHVLGVAVCATFFCRFRLHTKWFKQARRLETHKFGAAENFARLFALLRLCFGDREKDKNASWSHWQETWWATALKTKKKTRCGAAHFSNFFVRHNFLAHVPSSEASVILKEQNKAWPRYK